MQRMSREQQVRRTEGMQPWKRALVYEHGLKAVLEAQDANPNTPDHPPVITAWLEERRAKRQAAMLRECAGHTAAIANRVETARQARVQAVIEASEKTTQVSDSEEEAMTQRLNSAGTWLDDVQEIRAAEGCADAEGAPPPMQWDAPSAPPVSAWPRSAHVSSPPTPDTPTPPHKGEGWRTRALSALVARLARLFRKPRRSIP